MESADRLLTSLISTILLVASAMGARGNDQIYFPPESGEWEAVRPKDVGWDEGKLQGALRYAGQHNSSSVVILHRGRILAEEHWELNSAEIVRGRINPYHFALTGRNSVGHAIEDVASVQKSVVAVLLGMLVRDGAIELHSTVDTYLGKGWSRSPMSEARITVEHLICMTSGLAPTLKYDAEPGTKWRYNTTAYSRTVQVFEQVTASDVNELTEERLTDPLGMADSRWFVRSWVKSGDDANSIGFATTARDLARVGLMILANGKWGKKHMVERSYLSAALRSAQELNPAYGYLFWLNGRPVLNVAQGKLADDELISSAPSDLKAALGFMGRRLYIVPSMELVVTRLGDFPTVAARRLRPDDPSGLLDFDEQFWALLTMAAPKKK